MALSGPDSKPVSVINHVPPKESYSRMKKQKPVFKELITNVSRKYKEKLKITVTRDI